MPKLGPWKKRPPAPSEREACIVRRYPRCPRDAVEDWIAPGSPPRGAPGRMKPARRAPEVPHWCKSVFISNPFAGQESLGPRREYVRRHMRGRA